MSGRHERRKRSYESDRDRDSDSHHESKKSKSETTKAKVIWVMRGHKEVAAFSAINNPAVRGQGNRHRHVCSNCSTEYEHDHPYRKLEHPQHIKDCPKCKSIAPDDRPIERRSPSRHNNYKYANRNHRRYQDSYRNRNTFRRRSRSRSPRRKNRDHSPRRPSRR